ncbi:hypothetical protein, partial [Bacillus thuringiensis]|uniref:hypothetical protein n=1 Tax=Bacillus thuringiensis TaxID=1428 RepID=UPI001C92F19B
EPIQFTIHTTHKETLLLKPQNPLKPPHLQLTKLHHIHPTPLQPPVFKILHPNHQNKLIPQNLKTPPHAKAIPTPLPPPHYKFIQLTPPNY